LRQEGAGIAQMSVDDLAEKISVVYFETARNERGDVVKGEEITRCTVWAKVLPLTGKINDITPERENAVTYRITIRYGIEILPDDLIIWRSHRLKIITPPFDVESRHIWLQFDCRELVKDGRT